MDRLFWLAISLENKANLLKQYLSLIKSLKLEIISTRPLDLQTNSLKQLFFVATLMKIHIQQFILSVNSFFIQFVDREVVSTTPKCSLFAGVINQVSNSFPFIKQRTWIYLLNDLLQMWVMLIICKVFTIVCLLCLWGYVKLWQLSKSDSRNH